MMQLLLYCPGVYTTVIITDFSVMCGLKYLACKELPGRSRGVLPDLMLFFCLLLFYHTSFFFIWVDGLQFSSSFFFFFGQLACFIVQNWKPTKQTGG